MKDFVFPEPRSALSQSTPDQLFDIGLPEEGWNILTEKLRSQCSAFLDRAFRESFDPYISTEEFFDRAESIVMHDSQDSFKSSYSFTYLYDVFLENVLTAYNRLCVEELMKKTKHAVQTRQRGSL